MSKETKTKKKYVCKLCNNKEFSRKDALDRHMNTVHDKKKFKCPLCNQELSRKDLLDRHIRNFHNKEPSEVYKQFGKPIPIQETKEEKKEETKVEAKVEETKVEPKTTKKPRVLPSWIKQTDVESKEEGVLQETKGNDTKPIQSQLIEEVNKIKTSLLRQPTKIPTTIRNVIKVVKPTIEETKKRELFLQKERIRQQKIRDEQYEKEGRIQRHYNKEIIQGESKEDRARRLKTERQARWRAKKKAENNN